MPLTLTQITETVVLPNGTIPRNGRMEFRLRDWDKTADTLIMSGPIIAQLSEAGLLDVELQASTETDREMIYDVTVSYWSDSGRLDVERLPAIAVPAVGPVLLSTLLQNPAPEPLSADILAQVLAAKVNIDAASDTAVDAAAAAAASAALVDLGALDAAVADAIATAADRVQTGLDRAVTAADRVQTGLDRSASAASAAQAALYDGPRFDDFAAVVADTVLSYTVGAGKTVVVVGSYVLTSKGGFAYQVAASGATDHHVTTAGGVKLYVLAGADGSVAVSAFSASRDHTAIQAAINFFGTSRGKVQLGAGVYSCTASIDFKRVALNGVTVADGGQSGGTTLSFSGAFGLYSSIEDNQSPHHSNLRISGSAEKTANGQTLIDFTGLNYPRLTNVISYAAENGMKLAPGTVVECHYGSFVNYDASRCYRDVLIEGNVKTQSHSFFGGRSWDCVVCATNNGTEDINFFGRQFEGGLFPDHLADGASTKTFGCRFEGLTVSESPLLGNYQSFGDYTSGWQFRRAISFASGVATRNTARSVIGAVGADGAAISGPANLLRNPSLILDVNDPTKIAGWSAPAVTYTRLAGITGPILKGVAASSFFGFEQFGLDLPAGDYTVGFFIQRDDADVGFFSIILQLLDSAGVVINDSAGGGTDFNASNFTAISGNHRGNVVVRRIKLTTPRTNVRFRAAANGATGRTVYFGTPFLFFGHSGISPSISEPTFGRTLYGTAAPSAGTYRIGDIVQNTTPTAGGVMGWVCTTAGSPGTWKTFGAITP